MLNCRHLLICGVRILTATSVFWLTIEVLNAQENRSSAERNPAGQEPYAGQRVRRERHALLWTQTIEARERLERHTLLWTKPAGPRNPLPLERSQTPKQPAVVFLVPGTYGNEGLWTQVISEKATFASELQREAGPGSRAVAFVWRSSIHHHVRVKAAKMLAQEIDQKTKSGDRIVLVGHSHGGNVALLAASLCSRRIDMVVCLSTPHVYLKMRSGANDNTYDLPVYCPTEALDNIGAIVTLRAWKDAVLDTYADLRTGLDENDALVATRSWQNRTTNLIVENDSSAGDEFLEDLLGVQGVTNVVLSSQLNVAQANIAFPSQVGAGDGHHTVHSRRMGGIVGQLIRFGATDYEIHYLQTLTQYHDADGGEPVDESVHQAWLSSKSGAFQYTGWCLRSVTMRVENPDDIPDPYFRILSSNGHDELFRAHPVWNKATATWSPMCVLFANNDALFVAAEANFWNPRLLGQVQLRNNAGTGYPRVLQGTNWTAELDWMAVHE